MSDIVKNRVNNITFQFPLKGDDFKNENILAYNVQKFKEENKQESLILSKTLDIYKIYLKLGIFLIYRG